MCTGRIPIDEFEISSLRPRERTCDGKTQPQSRSVVGAESAVERFEHGSSLAERHTGSRVDNIDMNRVLA